MVRPDRSSHRGEDAHDVLTDRRERQHFLERSFRRSIILAPVSDLSSPAPSDRTGVPVTPNGARDRVPSRRVAGRREAILDAAAAMVAVRGAEGFRLGEVAAAAGVSKATLFRWFPSRANLVAALEAERGVAAAPGRRDQVIAAATGLFSRQGVRATTMEQVATAAGVSTPALYWHFASKLALAEAVIRTASPRPEIDRFFDEMVTGDLHADLTALIQLGVGFATRFILMLRIASDHHGEEDPLRDYVLAEVAMPSWARLAGYFEGHVALGNLHAAPPMPRVLSFVGMVQAAAFARTAFGNRVIDDLGAFAATFVATFLEGAATPAYRAAMAPGPGHA